jgi:signal transduction histidine kinase
MSERTEKVLHRLVVFGLLAAFIAAVYLGIVVGIGRLVGARDEPNLSLSIVATALVAVAFRPAREVAARWASRLVYGNRATPYQILARFSEDVAGTFATEDVLPRMAQVVAEGTGADRAEVWLRIGETLQLSASWPAAVGLPSPPVRLSGDDVTVIPSGGAVLPVFHHDELLGALAVTKPTGEAFDPGREKLLADLAAQAGLVLRNVRLTAELQAHVDEISRQAHRLRESRKRIVAAQDAERRRLERNIHDGAQQHLVALAVRIRMATGVAATDPSRAREMVAKLRSQAAEARQTLRDLGRGIYPRLLADRGLATALASQASKLPMVVEVEAEGLGRYPAEIEAAAYFSCLEALQNVAKYAEASRTVVRLDERDGALSFSVVDDGSGFDTSLGAKGSGLQNIADRVEALGGSLQIVSAPGEGTSVLGRIPLDQGEGGEAPSRGEEAPQEPVASAQA